MIGNMIGATYSSAHYEEYGKYKNKNLFEEVIDKMMLENFSPDFREKISTLSKKDKRMAILSLLDKDRNLFMKIKSLINEGLGKYEHIKDVILMLRDYVKVGEVEKKKYGEVMTPLELVKDMLNTLPDEVWTNPNLKWLDPANGTGPYPLMVIYKLMNGLSKCSGLENDEVRYKHIIENMIYVCELQPKNMFLYMCAVDPWDSHDLNIYTGSFLSDGFDKHMKEVWGVDKFDIIMGNPPYQEQKPGFKKTQTLWDKFVNKVMCNLNENGYLCFVHPAGWRDIDGLFKNTQKIMLDKQIISLSIQGRPEGIKNFGVLIRYDFYCLRNCKSNYEFKTKIRCQNGEIENVCLFGLEFVPNGMFSRIKSLIAKEGEEKVTILSNSSYHTQREYMSKEKKENFLYPCMYYVSKINNTTLWYSNTNERGHFGIPKVIWSNGDVTHVGTIVDENGEYGLTQFSYAIVDDRNLKNIKIAMDSKEFREIMENCSVAVMSINRKIIATFKKDFWKEFI